MRELTRGQKWCRDWVSEKGIKGRDSRSWVVRVTQCCRQMGRIRAVTEPHPGSLQDSRVGRGAVRQNGVERSKQVTRDTKRSHTLLVLRIEKGNLAGGSEQPQGCCVYRMMCSSAKKEDPLEGMRLTTSVRGRIMKRNTVSGWEGARIKTGRGTILFLLNNCTPPRNNCLSNGQRTCENVSECSCPGEKKKDKHFH